jgi:nucleotidyltransferase AbiEii toxin of type IV toxin-antitoxin system
MTAVLPELLDLAYQLLTLDTFADSFLAGGTNLAIRYNHRKSLDIDLFFSRQLGIEGFEAIEVQLHDVFGSKLLKFMYPVRQDDEFVFARALVLQNRITIKVEILQNMYHVHQLEVLNGIRAATTQDMGLYKLISASRRDSKKDIYDLDFITDEWSLPGLMKSLKKKMHDLEDMSKRSVFDIDSSANPISDPLALLHFDREEMPLQMPNHSSDHLDIIDGKSWLSARSSWRGKLRNYFKLIGVEFPKRSGSDLDEYF